jgi:integrase
MRDLLVCLNETGARPGEIYQLEASMYDERIEAIVPERHKNERHGRTRIIYVTDRLKEVLVRLRERYTTGRLLRNRVGEPWTDKTVDMWFLRTRKRLGLGKVTPYMYRHKLATEWLLKGGSPAYLSQLQGTGLANIENHYGHLDMFGEVLRQKVRELKGEAGGPGTGLGSGAAAGAA